MLAGGMCLVCLPAHALLTRVCCVGVVWVCLQGGATLAPWPDTSVHPLSSHIEEWVQRQKALMVSA